MNITTIPFDSCLRHHACLSFFLFLLLFLFLTHFFPLFLVFCLFQYPYCVVWTYLPLITTLIPCVGHVGKRSPRACWPPEPEKNTYLSGLSLWSARRRRETPMYLSLIQTFTYRSIYVSLVIHLSFYLSVFNLSIFKLSIYLWISPCASIYFMEI